MELEFNSEKILSVFDSERKNLQRLKAVLHLDKRSDFDVYDVVEGELGGEDYRRLAQSLEGALFYNFTLVFNNIFETCLTLTSFPNNGFTGLYIVRSKATRKAISDYLVKKYHGIKPFLVEQLWTSFVEIYIDEASPSEKNDNGYWERQLMREEWFQVALNAYKNNPDQLISPLAGSDYDPFENDADIPEKPLRVPYDGFQD